MVHDRIGREALCKEIITTNDTHTQWISQLCMSTKKNYAAFILVYMHPQPVYAQ